MYDQLHDYAMQPHVLEQTIGYVSNQLGRFVKQQDRVLICFPVLGPGSTGSIMEFAVRRLGATSLIWGPDYRWKSLLRFAFSSRATTIIGPPLIILGLAKLAKATATPLFIRNVLTAGYPCTEWMIQGIEKGYDCRTWGCFDPVDEATILGFSCGLSRGVHLRTDAYTVELLGKDGKPVSPGATGEVVFYPNDAPHIRYYTREYARIETVPCVCGAREVRLMDIQAGANLDQDLADVGAMLHSWTSILDCKVYRGQYGLELEIITFPGEKLPKLPSCAKQVVRTWDPERDMPFWSVPGWKNPRYSREKD